MALKDSDQSSDDSSLSDAESEDHMDVNEALKSSVKAALGNAAADSDTVMLKQFISFESFAKRI